MPKYFLISKICNIQRTTFSHGVNGSDQHSYLRDSYCFWRRLRVRVSVCCASVCSHKISETTEQKLMYLVEICTMVNARSGWKSVTFDLALWPRESYFRICSVQAIPFEWLYLATSFSVRRFIFKISRSRFSFKVIGPKSKSPQRKSGRVQLKKLYWSEI